MVGVVKLQDMVELVELQHAVEMSELEDMVKQCSTTSTRPAPVFW